MDIKLILGFMLIVFIDHNDAHGDAQMKIKCPLNHDVYNI